MAKHKFRTLFGYFFTETNNKVLDIPTIIQTITVLVYFGIVGFKMMNGDEIQLQDFGIGAAQIIALLYCKSKQYKGCE